MDNKLTKNFSVSEMRCKCDCHICNVDVEFLQKLQMARDLAGVSFTITSGCRCPDHNKEVGGTILSEHLTTNSVKCKGVDILCRSSNHRFKILEAVLSAGFKRIGISKNFIHLGGNEKFPQNVAWVY